MADSKVERLIYRVPPQILLGCCLTALGRMRAQIEHQDLEQGSIVATIGTGLFAPVSELTLMLAPVDDERTSLSVTWRARKWGGDRGILAAFRESVESLVTRSRA